MISDRTAWTLLAALAALRVLVLGVFGISGAPEDFVSPDSEGYLRLADDPSLFLGTTENYSLTRTPGYPLFLGGLRALFGTDPQVWVLPQALLTVATAYVVVTTLLRSLPTELRPGAFLAGALLLLDWTSVHVATQALTETLFTFLFVVAVALWVRALSEDSLWRSAGAGAVFGVALLVRPVLLLFSLCAVIACLLVFSVRMRRRLAHGIALALALQVVAGVWVLHNFQRSGHAFLSTIDAESVLLYRAAPTLAVAENISLAESLLRLQQRRDHLLRSSDPFERRSVQLQVGSETVARHPLAFVRVWFAGAARMLLGPGLDGLQTWFGRASSMIAAAVSAYLVCVYAAGALALRTLIRKRAFHLLVPLASPIAYLIAVSSGGESYSRFRVPWMPLACACAGIGMVVFWEWAVQRRVSKVAIQESVR